MLSAIVTVFTGIQAEHTVKVSGEAHEILENHEHFQITSTIVFVVLWIWRCIIRERIPKFAIIYFVITAIAVGAIFYGAHYGGELVYKYGVGTAVQPPV